MPSQPKETNVAKKKRKSRARKRNVTSSDERKPDIVAALLAKAGAGSKVTLVTEDCVAETFTGHVMQYDPRTRSWPSVGGNPQTHKVRGETVVSYDGQHTVTYAEVETVKAGGKIESQIEKNLKEKAALLATEEAEELTDKAMDGEATPYERERLELLELESLEGEALTPYQRDRLDELSMKHGHKGERRPPTVLVLVMEPGEAPDLREVDPEKLLEIVGGYPMVVGQSMFPRPHAVSVVVREFDWEGQAQAEGISPNFEIHGHVYHGPLIAFAADSDGNTVSLDADQAQIVLGRIARDVARVGAQS
jgi:hypothetical protein